MAKSRNLEGWGKVGSAVRGVDGKHAADKQGRFGWGFKKVRLENLRR